MEECKPCPNRRRRIEYEHMKHYPVGNLIGAILANPSLLYSLLSKFQEIVEQITKDESQPSE